MYPVSFIVIPSIFVLMDGNSRLKHLFLLVGSIGACHILYFLLRFFRGTNYMLLILYVDFFTGDVYWYGRVNRLKLYSSFSTLGLGLLFLLIGFLIR